MDVLALILACSLHPDDALVRTLVDVQSGGNVYFVGDLATLKTQDSLTSAADALRAADDIAGHGGRAAVGLLGIPLDWAARFGRSPRDLFDGCTNIAVGTAMLSSFEAECAPRAPARASARSARRSKGPARTPRPKASVRSCVLAHLASDLGVRGAPAELLKRVDVLALPAQLEAPPQTSSIFGDGADDSQALPAEWSDRRIYLENDPAVARGASGGSPVAPGQPSVPALSARPSATSSGLRAIPVERGP
jgi:hypothetical protein